MKKLGNGGSAGRPNEQIEDAEFIEIRGIRPPSEPAAPPPPKKMSDVVKAIIIGAIFWGALILFVELSSSDTQETASEPTTQNDTVVPQIEVPGDPSLDQLVRQNDPKACNHPDLINSIVAEVLPKPDEPYRDLTPAELRQTLALVRTDVELVRATEIDRDVHRIGCAARLRYGDGKLDYFDFTYQVQPSAKAEEGAVIEWVFPPFGPMSVMSDPIKSIEEQRRLDAPPVETRSPVDAPQTSKPEPEASASPRVATDDELFAPRP